MTDNFLQITIFVELRVAVPEWPPVRRVTQLPDS